MSDDYGYIYKITCPGEGYYIGSTNTPVAERFAKHKHRANNGERKGNLLYTAMRKVGPNNCKVTTLKTIKK